MFNEFVWNLQSVFVKTSLSRFKGMLMSIRLAKIVFILLTLFHGFCPTSTSAQGPTLPSVAKAAAEVQPVKAITAPTADNPEATAAEATGQIDVTGNVSDETVRRKLEKLLPKYPGVQRINVEVEDGVVTLTGQVTDAEVRDRLREFVRRVQGVNLVLNQTKTDLQVFTAREYAMKQISEYWNTISRKWVLYLFVVAMTLAALALARLFSRFSDILLTPFTSNVLLRSVLGSVITLAIALGGFLAGLHLLGMTEAVLSFMGLAGVVALAVGFAFRDIAENFIASVMLGVRRPFRVGDYLEVAGKAGVVKSLNTRATILVGLDGSHIRIPNAIIFKEILVNRTASTAMRASFDVLIPWDSSIATATEAITAALRTHEGFEASPSPRSLVEAIEQGSVRLRSYFWIPSQGIDRLKLLSDAQLAAKVALQKVGIKPASTPAVFQIPVAPSFETIQKASRTGINKNTESMDAAQTEANFKHDTNASSIAASQPPDDQQNEVQHALSISGQGADDEGRNLIGDSKRH